MGNPSRQGLGMVMLAVGDPESLDRQLKAVRRYV